MRNPFDRFDEQGSGNPFDRFDSSEKKSNPPSTSSIISSEPQTPEWAGKHPNLYGLYGAGRELYKTVGKPAIETAGMVGGGIVGAGSGFLAGAGLGAIPGAAAGAGLGYSGARNLTGAIDSVLEINRGDRATLPKVIQATAKDIALGSVGAGSPSKTALQKQISNARKIGTPISEGMLKETGIQLTPGEQTGGKTLAQVESLLEQVPFASDVMQNWREANQLKPLIAQRNKYIASGEIDTPRGELLGQKIKEAIDKRLGEFDISKTGAMNDLRDSMLKKLGSSESYESLSKGAQEILSTRSAEAVAKKNALYQAVNDVMPQGELPFTNYQQQAQMYLDEVSKLPNADKSLINILRWGTDVKQNPKEIAFLSGIAQYPPHVQQQLMAESGIQRVTKVMKDWKTMQNHRNQLNDLIKANDLSIKNASPNLKGQLTNEGRIYKNLRAALDKDFEQIAQKQGGEVLDRFKVAQAFYSDEFAPVWKQKTIREMAYKNPDELINVAIKKGSTTEVSLARKALGNDGFDKTIKPAFTNKILGAGRDETFNPKQLQKTLNDYGDATLLKIYSPSELNALKEISKTGQLYLTKELPNASLLKAIAKNPNNVIVDSILGAVENHASSTTVLKNITILNEFMSPQQKAGVKLELIDRVFRLNKTTEQVEALSMAKNIDKYRAALRKYFTPSEIDGLDKIAAIGRQMSRAQQMAANPSGTAKNVIAFGASNELIFKPFETALRGKFLEAAGQFAVAGVSKVLGARKLAELYINPKTRQLLIKGMATPSNTKEGINLAKQLSIVIGNEAINDESIEGRASGGPVKKGKPYIVGEKGPEIIVPSEDSFVLPSEKPIVRAAEIGHAGYKWVNRTTGKVIDYAGQVTDDFLKIFAPLANPKKNNAIQQKRENDLKILHPSQRKQMNDILNDIQ